MLDELPRSKHIAQTKRTRSDSEHVVVQQVIVFSGGFVDAVDICRSDEVVFGDRQRERFSVDLSRAGEHDLDSGVEVATSLEQTELTSAVDLEIRIGIPHAVDVADLTGKVEDDFDVADEIVQGALLPYVGHVDAN